LPQQVITEAGGSVKAAKRGLLDVQIITPGWGSSGYYSPQVLEAAARSQVFRKGTKMFLDHPTPMENDERPNRSVKDLAAVLAEDARWDGTALRAPVRTFGQWRDVVAEMVEAGDSEVDVIGVSIRADAQVSEGEAEGRSGYIIQEISNARSVDFVTEAGRGGRILQVLESARNEAVAAALTEEEPTLTEPEPETTPVPEPTPDTTPPVPEVAPQDPAPENPPAADPSVGTAETTPTQEEKMPPEANSGSGGTAPPRTTLQAYEERIAAKEREIAEMRAREHARGIVAEDLELAVLPPLVRQRLSEELLSSMPMNNGELDVVALRDRIAAKRDRAELEIGEALQLMGGHGQVRGLGGSMVAEDSSRVDEFQSQAAKSLGIFGVSEEAARAAVKGGR